MKKAATAATSSAEAAAFAAIVRSSEDAVIAKTVSGVVTAWNDGAVRLYGYSAAQIIGQNIDVTFPAEELESERRRHERAAAGAPEIGYRCTRVRADGQHVSVVMSMSPVRDEDGGVVGVASISRPVSALEHHEARFAALLEAAPDAIVCVGRDGRIATVNGQVTRMFGYERDALIGADLELLLPEGLGENVPHGGSFARREGVRARAMGRGLALLARRRDGSTFPVEVTHSPDAGADGLVIASLRDVTEQRELEAISLEGETRLRQLAESVDIVFVLLQLEPRKILYISPSGGRLLGVTGDSSFPESAMGVESLHPDDRERVEREFVMPTRVGLEASSEHRMVDVNGAVKWVRMFATPVPNPRGPPERSVITVEDISDRVQAAEALRAAEAAARAANEAKNEFLSRMSHELRTPLNAVLGFGQLLSRALAGTEHAEAIGHVLKGGRHLLDLINDVLDIARIEAGEMSISLEPVPVVALIDETLELMQPLADEAGVTLVAAAGPDDVHVLADRQRLRQVFLNLISNAIKYNHRGGSVWFDWHVHGGRASLQLRDDGQGISPDMLGRLFTAFDRLGAEGSEVEGTGIGLALTRSLVELMDGSITVRSVAAEGSSFTVELPTAAPAGLGRADVPWAGRGGARPSRGRATVLYIEDNQPNVRVVEHILRLRPGWRLIHAGLGRLGVELAEAHRPDLILLDLHLPDLSGLDVLITLKNHPETSAIPVAILTADASASQPRQLIQAGAQHFLTKPLDVDQLLALFDAMPVREP
jgi:PAS domain S-box-containing protein